MRAYALLSTSNLLNNLAIIKSYAPKSKIIAMVKANAYGHGIRSIALRLDGKVDCMGVASLDEAMILKSVGIKTKILLMEGVFSKDEMVLAIQNCCDLVIHTKQQIEWLKEVQNIGMPQCVWIKIDTGMGRLGFKIDDFDKIFHEASKLSKNVGLMSHFANSEEKNDIRNSQQVERFRSIKTHCIKSMANAGAIFNFPETHFDYVRPGISLYGVSPIKNQTFNLKSVMTLKSRIIAINQHFKGDQIGYGGKYICNKDCKIAIVSIGYGDGYPRSSKSNVVIHNKQYPIVGNISMDMMSVKVDESVSIGDEVILWGEGGVSVETVADSASTISYELLCNVQLRVKFYWE